MYIAFRVPAMVRWPGRIQAGQVLNGLISHADWFTTFLAAAGEPDIADKLSEAGFDFDKRKIQLDEPIKRLGDYEVKIKLHHEVTATLKVLVSMEPDSDH